MSSKFRHNYSDVSGTWVEEYAGISNKYELFPAKWSELRFGNFMTRDEVAVAMYQYLGKRERNISNKNFVIENSAKIKSDLQVIENAISTSNAKARSINYGIKTGAGIHNQIQTDMGYFGAIRGAKIVEIDENLFHIDIISNTPRAPDGQKYIAAFLTNNLYQIISVQKNTNTKPTAIVKGYYRQGAVIDQITENIEEGTNTVTLNNANQFVVGDILSIEDEEMIISNIIDHSTLVVKRGVNSTIATMHRKSAPVKLKTFAKDAEGLICFGTSSNPTTDTICGGLGAVINTADDIHSSKNKDIPKKISNTEPISKISNEERLAILRKKTEEIATVFSITTKIANQSKSDEEFEEKFEEILENNVVNMMDVITNYDGIVLPIPNVGYSSLEKLDPDMSYLNTIDYFYDNTSLREMFSEFCIVTVYNDANDFFSAGNCQILKDMGKKGVLPILISNSRKRMENIPKRVRDTDRFSHLENISYALQSYYDDNGQYPSTTNECLDPNAIDGITAPEIGLFIKGGKVPSDTLTTSNTDLCTGNKSGRYWYRSLSKNRLSDNAFILCADVENITNANAISSNISPQTTYSKAQEQLLGYESNELMTAEQSDPATTLYCIVGK